MFLKNEKCSALRLDERKLISFELLSQILDVQIDQLIRPLIPNNQLLTLSPKTNLEKPRKINQFYEILDETNIFLISKTVEILAGGSNFGEKPSSAILCQV